MGVIVLLREKDPTIKGTRERISNLLMEEAVNLQMDAGIGESAFDMLRKPWGLKYLRESELGIW